MIILSITLVRLAAQISGCKLKTDRDIVLSSQTVAILLGIENSSVQIPNQNPCPCWGPKACRMQSITSMRVLGPYKGSRTQYVINCGLQLKHARADFKINTLLFFFFQKRRDEFKVQTVASLLSIYIYMRGYLLAMKANTSLAAFFS